MTAGDNQEPLDVSTSPGPADDEPCTCGRCALDLALTVLIRFAITVATVLVLGMAVIGMAKMLGGIHP